MTKYCTHTCLKIWRRSQPRCPVPWRRRTVPGLPATSGHTPGQTVAAQSMLRGYWSCSACFCSRASLRLFALTQNTEYIHPITGMYSAISHMNKQTTKNIKAITNYLKWIITMCKVIQFQSKQFIHSFLCVHTHLEGNNNKHKYTQTRALARAL